MLNPLSSFTPPTQPAAAAPVKAAPGEREHHFAQALRRADQGPAGHHGAHPAAKLKAKAELADDRSKPTVTSSVPTDAPPTDGPAPTSVTAGGDEAAASAAAPSDAAALLAALPPLPDKPLPPPAPAPGSTRSEGVREPMLATDGRDPELQPQPLPGQAGAAAATGLAQAAETFATALREQQAAPAAEAKPTEQIPALPIALTAPTATTVSASAPVEARIAASPGSADFPSQLGLQLSTFVREGVQHAKLELHPVELGPVTVQIQLDGNQAQINLSADQAPTRQALEQALPNLAASLREAGLTLSGGGVFEQPRQPAPEPGAAPSARGGRGSGADRGTDSAALPTVAATRRRGVVDLVA